MQRAWPVLAEAQRQQWLGPVRRWWMLEQPWRPWSLADLVQRRQFPPGSLPLAPHVPLSWPLPTLTP